MSRRGEYLERQLEKFEAQQARINARTGRNLAGAIVIGLVLAGAVLFSLIWVKELFVVVAGVLAAFGAAEHATGLRVAGRDVPRIPLTVFAAFTPAVGFWFGLGWMFAYLAVAMVVVGGWRVIEVALGFGRPENSAALRADLVTGAFVLLYVPMFAGFAAALTAAPGGQWWTLAVVFTVAAADTGAYAAGLAFGKHKMAPRISPSKSWEGFAGAVVASQAFAIGLSVWLLREPVWVGVIFGLVIVLVATGGDLVESLMKRDLGVKDFSSWLPGHGGFLDRFDSMLPSAFAGLCMYVIFATLHTSA